jgi:hypothetical protein
MRTLLVVDIKLVGNQQTLLLVLPILIMLATQVFSPDLSYLCSNGVPDTTLGVFDTDLFLCIQEIPGCTDSQC